MPRMSQRKRSKRGSQQRSGNYNLCENIGRVSHPSSLEGWIPLQRQRTKCLLRTSISTRPNSLPGRLRASCSSFEFFSHPALEGGHVLGAAQEILNQIIG